MRYGLKTETFIWIYVYFKFSDKNIAFNNNAITYIYILVSVKIIIKILIS